MKRLLAILALLASCGEPETGPAPLALGEDGCDVCRMIISELPYAAQARFEDGRVERYDDLGCLAERLKKGPAPREAWVVDGPSGRWVDARTAVFVRKKGLQTPMYSELAAFASAELAERAGGARMTYADLQSLGRPE